MSDQIENEQQQSMTPEEVRQSLLAEIDATQQAIAELSNEQLEEVVGGAGKGLWQSLKGSILGCAGCGAQPTYMRLDLSQSPIPGQKNLERLGKSPSPDVRERALGNWVKAVEASRKGSSPTQG